MRKPSNVFCDLDPYHCEAATSSRAFKEASMVINTHERSFNVPATHLERLIDQLASSQDIFWPSDRWPPMRFDGPLAVGARGGHGPIQYVIERYEPGRVIEFRFTAPAGFNGTHRLTLEAIAPDQCRIQHEIRMTLSGSARLSWPLAFWPMHDALLEDALDRAEAFAEGKPVRQREWTPWVKALRWLRAKRPRRSRTAVT